MHNFILKCFKKLNDFWHFLKIVCVFCIMMLMLLWIQNLICAEWTWMAFITPFLNKLLDISNNICSISFELWGAVFEFKYISATIILVSIYLSMNLLIMFTQFVEAGYKSTHFICKKTSEALLNKNLKEEVEKEELKIKNYSVVIQTALKPNFSHAELNIDINEHNKFMLDFLSEKLGKKPKDFQGNFLYTFNDFNKIDRTLKILFKLINSNTPIEHAICIQSGNNDKQLRKLVDLKHFGKITMAADTAYRYKFNDNHGFEVSQIGLFQYENRTMEVHEFKEFVV